MKKTIITTIFLLVMSHMQTAQADYVFCQAYKSSNNTYYFSGVFYTSESNPDRIEEERDFTLHVNGAGSRCAVRETEKETKRLLNKRFSEAKYNAKARKTGWKP